MVGGTLYAGAKTYQRFKTKGFLSSPQAWFSRRPTAMPVQADAIAITPDLHKANQSLAVAAIGFGLTAAGAVLMAPALSLASVPLVLYVFAPTFQAAYHTAVKERCINNQVLDATRIMVCVIMGYDLIAALNACLQAGSQKFFAQAEAEFQQQLHTLFGADQTTAWKFTGGAEVQTTLAKLTQDSIVALGSGDTIPAAGVVLYGTAWVDERVATGNVEPVWKAVSERVVAASVVQSGRLYVQLEEKPPLPVIDTIRRTLAQGVARKTRVQQIGEANADRMAPWMLTSFVVTLPLLGANHAAAFLTTGFGAHLRTLGPYTVRNFLIPAAQQGIVIKDAHALEAAMLINTLIFDQRVLTDPIARASAKTTIQALRTRPWLLTSASPHRFAVYVMVDEGDEALAHTLVAELGLDDYFAESSVLARTVLLERLSTGGRLTCYVGVGEQDEAVMAKAQVALAWRGVNTIATHPAQVVLLDRELHALVRFFELAAAFTAKQGFNLVTPIGLDLVDIATTLFIHLGLVYSVLFNYAGLLLGAAGAHFPTPARSQVANDAAEPLLALPGKSSANATAPSKQGSG